MLFPLSSSCDLEVRPDVNHFGRSLLGGYSPQYMPDFVLHGVTSDQRLKQCLMADLEHTVLVSIDPGENNTSGSVCVCVSQYHTNSAASYWFISDGD